MADKCDLCGAEADREEYLCYGCNAVVCDIHSDAPVGQHEPDDHHAVTCDACGEPHPDGECPFDDED